MVQINVIEIFPFAENKFRLNVKEINNMATLNNKIQTNTNFLPPGNTPKPGIITPKSKVIAEKTDIPTSFANENADPSHD